MNTGETRMGVHQRHKVKLGKVRLERSTKAFHTLLETERERNKERKKKEKRSVHIRNG